MANQLVGLTALDIMMQVLNDIDGRGIFARIHYSLKDNTATASQPTTKVELIFGN